MTSVEKVEGETIEQKIERIMTNKEPIKDGAPLIYTERKDGINAAYNIRTDRWEIATDAMDLVHKNTQAKRDAKSKKPDKEKEEIEEKTEDKTEDKGKNSGAESIQASAEPK